MAKKTEEQKAIERSIRIVLSKKDKLVARRLRIEIENRIIERKMNFLSNELNALINSLLDVPPALNMEEIRTAQINRLSAISMVRKRLPDLSIEDARELVNRSLEASKRPNGEA